MKKILTGIILIAVLIYSLPLPIYAQNAPYQIYRQESAVTTIGELGGYLEGNIKSVESIISGRNFSYAQGHGFAAERGNNLIDVLRIKMPRFYYSFI